MAEPATTLLRAAVAGEAVELHAGRALYWPARRRLVIADLHLGKGDAFRRAGIAVPSGGSGDDLERLAGLLARTGATSLWVLGDMLHGDPSPRRWRERWDSFRAAHAGIGVVVIAGNHDRALAGAGLGIEVAMRPLRDGPFVFAHEPAGDSDAFVLSGHLHPVLTLPGLRRRFPAFVLEPASAILPAFSLFTGGVACAAAPGRRRYACVDDTVIAITDAAASPDADES